MNDLLYIRGETLIVSSANRGSAPKINFRENRTYSQTPVKIDRIFF